MTMTKGMSLTEQFNQRSSPVWRWIAAFLILLNGICIVKALFATFVPRVWADSDPYSGFSFIAAAVVLLQFAPFARSIWLGDDMASQNGEIDEYERLVNQKVVTKAYRTTGACMMISLLLLMLLDQFADIKLTNVAAGYWLMAFTMMFFSLPTIFASFIERADTDLDFEQD
jgi:hypothetical protein